MRILSRSDTLGVIDLPACVAAVEEAFTKHGEGRSLEARRVHVPALLGGVFHVTAGGLASSTDAGVVGVKVNGRFPPRDAGGSQRVSGAVLLSDAASGAPLGLLDSMVVTSMRTAAVTAIVTNRLARGGASEALLVGAGRQAIGQVDALALTGRFARLGVYDVVAANAQRVARYAEERGLAARLVDDLPAAARTSDVIVTITPARSPLLSAGDVSDGALVVALGADGPGKQELDPQVLARARVVVDILEQAEESGELQHALAAGLMRREDVYAELGELLAGRKAGRSADDERFVFDGTGTALQDVAAAGLILQVAAERGLGVEVQLDA